MGLGQCSARLAVGSWSWLMGHGHGEEKRTLFCSQAVASPPVRQSVRSSAPVLQCSPCSVPRCPSAPVPPGSTPACAQSNRDPPSPIQHNHLWLHSTPTTHRDPTLCCCCSHWRQGRRVPPISNAPGPKWQPRGPCLSIQHGIQAKGTRIQDKHRHRPKNRAKAPSLSRSVVRGWPRLGPLARGIAA